MGHERPSEVEPGASGGFERHLGGALQADGVGGGVGEIDDAVAGDGAAIVDADDDAAMIAKVGDANPAAQGKAAMSAGEIVHVELFAGGGLASLELKAVPGGLADSEPAVEGGGTGDMVAVCAGVTGESDGGDGRQGKDRSDGYEA